MLKICFIGSDGVPGGVSNYLINLVNSCEKSSIKFFIFGKNYKYFKKKIKTNFRFIDFSINYNLFNLFSTMSDLKKKIINNDINIIHAHTQRAAFLACLAKIIFLRINVKIIYTPHGFRYSQLSNPNRQIHFQIEKFILKRIKQIILISKKEVNLIKKIGVNIKKTFIETSIPNIKIDKSVSLQKKINLKKKY